jgi:hypothetical protein
MCQFLDNISLKLPSFETRKVLEIEARVYLVDSVEKADACVAGVERMVGRSEWHFFRFGPRVIRRQKDVDGFGNICYSAEYGQAELWCFKKVDDLHKLVKVLKKIGGLSSASAPTDAVVNLLKKSNSMFGSSELISVTDHNMWFSCASTESMSRSELSSFIVLNDILFSNCRSDADLHEMVRHWRNQRLIGLGCF